jgi:flagellar biosynthesis chaperone FliJ
MKFIVIIGVFIILVGVGISGGMYYYNSVNDSFAMKQSRLEKSIKDKALRFEQQLSSYKNYETKLNKKFKVKEKYLETKHKKLVAVLKGKYGEYDKFKITVRDSFSSLEKDINQREKSLKDWEKELIKKEKELITKESIINSINLECKLFDKKKLEKYLRAYKRVSYANLEYVSLACGTNIQGQKVNNDACLQSKKDRLKAKSILTIIDELSPHVANGMEYKKFSNKARSIMNF